MAEFLLGSMCVLAAVTVIGHGIWVAIAWIFRVAAGPPPVVSQGPTQRGPCPRCGAPLHGGSCPSCGWSQLAGPSPPRPAQALSALSQQLAQAHGTGALDAESFRSLERVIQDRQAALAAANLSPTAPSPALSTTTLAASAADTSPATAVPSGAPETDDLITADLVEALEVVETAPALAAAEPASAARDEREFVSTAPVAERAERFQASQQRAAEPVAPFLAPPKPKLTHWLAAFMEERNMRWGELVGGLLIVCCSTALVISFWSAIAERPWLKFFLFNGVTAGLFGVGFHSHYRWRLHTTSQGLLIIASMLVPLNFLAIAAFSAGTSGDGMLTIAGEAVSVVLFATLVYFAGQILVNRGAAVLVVGLLIPSLAQLLVRRYVDPAASRAALTALSAVPLAAYLSVNGLSLKRAADNLVLSEYQVNGLFKFLGLTTFAVLLPLALLLFKSEQPLATLRQLSLMLAVLGIVPLSAGVLLWQKLAGRGMTALRTAGTSVGACGALVSLAGLVMAWPEPGQMLPVALVEFAVFTFVAWRFQLPWAHLVAAPCLSAAYLLCAHLLNRQITWGDNDAGRLASTLISGGSGTLLAPLAFAYAAVALGLKRIGHQAATVLAWTAGMVALVSVALVSWFGFGEEGDPLGAAWVYGLYAVVCLLASARSRRASLAWMTAGLLLASVVQWVAYRYGEIWQLSQPELISILAYCTLTAVLALAVGRSRLASPDSPLADVLWNATFFCSLTGAGWLISVVRGETATFEALGWLWLAAIWLSVAWATGWPAVATMFQAATALATIFGVVAFLERQPWFRESRRPWLDPWTLSAIGTALAGFGLAWTAVRLAAAWNSRRSGDEHAMHAPTWWNSRWLGVDRVTSAGALVLLVVVGCYAALPGTLLELSPRPLAALAPNPAPGSTASGSTAAVPVPRVVSPLEDYEFLSIPHAHAAGGSAWLFWGAMLVLIVAIVRQRMSLAWLLALFVVAAVACPLLATRWEAEVAVASALRWLSAGFLLCASVPIWGRDQLTRLASQLGWQSLAGDPLAARSARALVFWLGLLPSLAMIVGVGLTALVRSPQSGQVWSDTYALIITFALAVLLASALWSVPGRVGPTRVGHERPTWNRALAALALVLGSAPILSMLLYHVGLALRASPILGPNPDTVFARMGLASSYAAPILIMALVLVGYAIRERSSGFALAGGLVLNAAATAAYLLAISKGGLNFDAAQWIRLAQLNAAVAACYAMAWLAAVSRRRESPAALATDFPLNTSLALAPALTFLALGSAWCRLFWSPRGNAPYPYVMNTELADAWGWLSFALTCASASWGVRATGRRLSSLGVSAFLTALVVFAAVLAAPWDTPGDWLSYNVLLVGHAVVASLLTALAWRRATHPASSATVTGVQPQATRGGHGAFWVVLQGVFMTILSLRELIDNRWWPVGGLAFLGLALAPAWAWIDQRRRYLYLAAALINVAGSIAWLEVQRLAGFESMYLLNVTLLAAPIVAWLGIELKRIRRRGSTTGFVVAPMHRTAIRIAVPLLALAVASGLASDAARADFMGPHDPLRWIALAVVLIGALAQLWDDESRESVALLYFVGLIACGMLVDEFNLPPRWLLWTGAMVTAAYALGTSYLWSRRAGLGALAARLRVPPNPRGPFAGLRWLVPCNLLLVLAVVAMTVLVLATNEQTTLRVLAAQATLTQVASLGLLARGDRRGVLQTMALVLGAIGAVLFGCAWLPLTDGQNFLNLLVMSAAGLALVAVLYGFGLGKFLADSSDWLAPARRLTPWLAAGCGVAIVATLGGEIFEFSRGGEVRMAWPAIATVAVTLAGLALAALAAAVLPGRDPLGLSERGRMLYVYGAEIVLALLFVHLRLTMPWMFGGVFQQYWPLVVMGIAYLGIGLAEFFRRRQQNVLARPIENTGALLPVLPVLGYWSADTEVDYSLLLLCVGLLYGALSIARRSFGFGILAALAANGGLWYFLNRQDGLGFLAHPQVWIIPPALCVLAAAYLNRAQLSEAQMTAARYFTSMAIYISSTGDIFLNGTAQAPWLPLVLAVLSILGVLAGILLRVRAFLFMGTGFLVLAMFTIIYHAAHDLEQTWIIWVSGIVLGVMVLALFAVFEKKRQEVLHVFEKIKTWDA